MSDGNFAQDGYDRSFEMQSRRNTLKKLCAGGASLAGIGSFVGSVQASQVEMTTLNEEIPTEPENRVYTYTDEQQYLPGDYEISHTMEWFRSVYTSGGSWLHDFSIQSQVCSRHHHYNTLIPECSGWGYRIEGPDGYIAALVDEDFHGVYPEGDGGDPPEWTETVMEGALGAMSTSASLLYTAQELQELMEPADGFDTSLDDGFRWLKTHGFFDDHDEQVSMQHRVFYNSSSHSPEIETNATVRVDHDPLGSDTWLDMEVTTNGQNVADPASSLSTNESTEAHPKDMDSETIQNLGIKKVDGDFSPEDTIQESTSNGVLNEEVTPEYVMTNCPWESEININITERDIHNN